MRLRANAVRFDRVNMYVDLDDGRKLTMALASAPTLEAASQKERRIFDIEGDRIYWPLLDQTVSLTAIHEGSQRAPIDSAAGGSPERVRPPIDPNAKMPLVTALERRMASGEPFTLAEAIAIEPAMEGRLADRTMQKWRKAGWLTYTRKNGTWWSLTDFGVQCAAAARAERDGRPSVAVTLPREDDPEVQGAAALQAAEAPDAEHRPRRAVPE